MILLRPDIAVIGALHEKLRSGSSILCVEDVIQYSCNLEDRSGYAIINDFSAKSLVDFFGSYPQIFQPTDDSLMEYIFEEDNLRRYCPFIEDVTLMLIKYIDPAINYPLDLLEQMGILGVITSP